MNPSQKFLVAIILISFLETIGLGLFITFGVKLFFKRINVMIVSFVVIALMLSLVLFNSNIINKIVEIQPVVSGEIDSNTKRSLVKKIDKVVIKREPNLYEGFLVNFCKKMNNIVKKTTN